MPRKKAKKAAKKKATRENTKVARANLRSSLKKKAGKKPAPAKKKGSTKPRGFNPDSPLKKRDFLRVKGKAKYKGDWLVIDLDRDGIHARNVKTGKKVNFKGQGLVKIPPPAKIQVHEIRAIKQRLDGKPINRPVPVIIAADGKSVLFGCEKIFSKDIKRFAKLVK
jgi:hypothetical protein